MATDTLTVKFSLSADFQTIQSVRHTLLAQPQQAALSSLLSDTLTAYLASLLHTDFQLQTALHASRPQPHHTGPRQPIPICQEGVLRWYDAEADLTNVVGRVGSHSFLEALHSQAFKSFRYLADPHSSITVYCRADGKWYAAKRLKGRLKRRYLGRPENISVSKLNQITRDLLDP